MKGAFPVVIILAAAVIIGLYVCSGRLNDAVGPELAVKSVAVEKDGGALVLKLLGDEYRLDPERMVDSGSAFYDSCRHSILRLIEDAPEAVRKTLAKSR